MIGQTIGHYHIVEELGAGGMGVVYRAEDTKLKRSVALKFLPPELTRDAEARRRFLHEAQAAAALDHPNICTVHEVDETPEGRVYIAMACYAGETLRERIAKGPLPLPEALRIAKEAATGLAHAHGRGIVHRDVKPANIFVCADGLVKVLDFGLAKLAAGSAVTKTGTTLGTTGYMSPEQAKGQPVDGRTDIWSLGVVLYEMVAGRPPFAGEYPQAVVYGIINEEPEPLSKVNPAVPPELERVIRRCLAKDPGQRFQRMAEMVWELAAKGQRPPVPARILNRTGPWLRRHRLAALLTGLLIVAAAGLAYWFWPKVGAPTPAGPLFEKIAVLPLSNLSGDPSQEYFADAMTEALIMELCKIEKLTVISRTTMMRYKKTDKSIPEIAKELHLDAIVEGSAQKVGERVRITAQLIAAAEDKHLWAAQYDRSLSDVLMLQSEVARAIAGQVRVALTPADRRRLNTKRRVNPAAYEQYLQVADRERKLLWLPYKQWEEGLRHVLAIDPNFVDARADLAVCIVDGTMEPGYSHRSMLEALPLARAEIEKARQLDPDSAKVHGALSKLFLYEYDWLNAERELEIAAALHPGDPEALFDLAFMWMHAGRFSEACALERRKWELERPDAPELGTICPYMGFWSETLEEAVAGFQTLLRYAQDDFGKEDCKMNIGLAYMLHGRFQEAVERLEQLDPSWLKLPYIKSSLAYCYGRLGRRDEARRILVDFLAVREDNTAYMSPTSIALVYEGLGERGQAFAWLERGYEEHSRTMRELIYLPIWTRLRDDPRYIALLDKMNVPPDWRRK
ncbi:MAG TPA: protein kinase [Verrucomicrobiota bacterium]|nr:protein kinase [Verrucomicrobiota bacterium]